MQAFAIDAYGGPERVTLHELDVPSVGPEDILIRVRAASVNPVDIKIRQGGLKRLLSLRFPLIMGSDVSGMVVACGEAVTRFELGDDVYARLEKLRIGAFAEYAVVNAAHAARKPANLSHVEAAAIPLAGLTALQALRDLGHLTAGQKVLIQAGAGGVGTLAIQLARHMGATVATTTSERNETLVRGLGAEIVVDYHRERFDECLRDYDVVLDSLGGENLERAFAILRPGGVVVSITGLPDDAFARDWGMGPIVRLALLWMNRRVRRAARQHQARYAFLFMRPDGEQLDELRHMLEAGTLRPVIDQVYPFEETREALAHVESGRARGKVVIEMPSER